MIINRYNAICNLLMLTSLQQRVGIYKEPVRSWRMAERLVHEDTKDQSPARKSPLAKKAKKNPNRRQHPNAFVSLQIQNAQVKERMIAIQQQMIENDESIEPLVISPAKFHLTLMVTRLDEESTLGAAQDALDESGRMLTDMLSNVEFEFDKLSSFKQQVVFAGMSNTETIDAFERAAMEVRQIFSNHGLPIIDERTPTPHVTLFKGGKIPRSIYESIAETNCGRESFDTLQLCSMTKPKQPNGYYHVFKTARIASIVDNSGKTKESAIREDL
ncbi:A-kinase anchor protein 7-like [Watersipora subatra]|uniref:A-kinase anchor protein 7-like n=1 Tax=Watersipora subatra TaxID=2589382 RepID=UPI00355C48AF